MKKETITGEMNVALEPVKALPPSDAQSYFFAAKQLYFGVLALMDSSSDVILASSLLAAQSLECALKAYLSFNGTDEKNLKNINIRHNLEKLWLESERLLLGISDEPPQWCISLNTAHDKPYFFRYPMKLNGMIYPNQEEMERGLGTVISTVERALQRKP